jgi:hypothetical protein
MLEFDREQLRAILVRSKIEVSKRKIDTMDSRLRWIKFAHQAKKGQILGVVGPSEELVQLYVALRQWLDRIFLPLSLLEDGDECWAATQNHNELELVTEGDQNKVEQIFWLTKATFQAINDLEYHRPHQKPPDLKKGLFTAFYRLYCELTGSAEMSDSGPSIRFVVECAKLVDPEIRIPKGHALRDQLARDSKCAPRAEQRDARDRRKTDRPTWNDIIETLSSSAGYER